MRSGDDAAVGTDVDGTFVGECGDEAFARLGRHVEQAGRLSQGERETWRMAELGPKLFEQGFAAGAIALVHGAGEVPCGHLTTEAS